MAGDDNNANDVLSTDTISGAIGFIGAGNMAQAIAFPLIKKRILDPLKIKVSATSSRNLRLWEELQCTGTTKNEDVIVNSDVIIWAVKPQMFPGVISTLAKVLSEGAKLQSQSITHVSVMAGISITDFEAQIKKISEIIDAKFRCFRVMPNIGLKVSCGVAVYSGPFDITETEQSLLQSFFKPIGLVYEVPEHQINAYCGLFGSGIGFMFPIIEALSDGAVKMGIPRNISLEIAAQVMKGAGELILKEKLHPGVMKDAVCSPGGTTIAGVAELENGGVRSSIIKAVEAATVRGQVLGGGSKK